MFKSGFFPYGWSFIGEDDIAAVSEALHHEILTTGPLVDKFEVEFAKTVNARESVSVNSGTAALHLAAMAIDLQPDEWVIVPAMTFSATANVARHMGAEVIFADVDPNTGLMTPETLTEAIKSASGKKLRAVFVVHMNGNVADMAGLSKVARAHDLRIIEDACHAVASTYLPLPLNGSQEPILVGACEHSDFACFSFHPVKTITTGEGGALTFNDSSLKETLKSYRTHGIVRDINNIRHPELALDKNGDLNPWYYEMQFLGHNFRMTDFQCALGSRQLEKLPDFAARRRKFMKRYDERFAPFRQVMQPVSRLPGTNPCLHLYALLIDFEAIGRTRAEMMTELRARKIGTQVHYIPVHYQPYYRERYGKIDLPGTAQYYERVLSIPFYPAMKDEDIEFVADNICDVLGLRAKA